MKQQEPKIELKQADLRATPARVAIMELLRKIKQPMDTNTLINLVNKQGVKTDPTTVFRIMNALTRKGLTLPIQFLEGKTRYELAGKKHHHHLVCENCGRIEDVLPAIVPTLEKEIQKKYKFLVRRHSLEFFGLCSNCQK